MHAIFHCLQVKPSQRKLIHLNKYVPITSRTQLNDLLIIITPTPKHENLTNVYELQSHPYSIYFSMPSSYEPHAYLL